MQEGQQINWQKAKEAQIEAHRQPAKLSSHHVCVLESKAVCAPQKPANLVTLPLVVVVVPVSACVPCCTERRYSVPGSPEVVTERYELQPE